MADDAAFIWDRPTDTGAPRRRPVPASADDAVGRITLREAEHRFGVRTSTLRAWSRKESIDAVLVSGPHGEQWMVTPESVAHHLSRHSPKTGGAGTRRSGPAEDGTSMLVPRDAWDKLMDQLGNLHESGLHLAEARERAARAETEATFLRERLAEMRSERDGLREAASGPAAPEGGEVQHRPAWTTLLERYARRRRRG